METDTAGLPHSGSAMSVPPEHHAAEDATYVPISMRRCHDELSSFSSCGSTANFTGPKSAAWAPRRKRSRAGAAAAEVERGRRSDHQRDLEQLRRADEAGLLHLLASCRGRGEKEEERQDEHRGRDVHEQSRGRAAHPARRQREER